MYLRFHQSIIMRFLREQQESLCILAHEQNNITQIYNSSFCYNLLSHFQPKHITSGHEFQLRGKVHEKESTN